MVNEEEVVGASATASEGAHHLHLHCAAPGMTYVVACGLDDITHSPYTATLTAACSYVSDLGHLCPGCTYDPSVWFCVVRVVKAVYALSLSASHNGRALTQPIYMYI